ncbi:hypothetical protein HH1059_20210 [Halorhodospira halochloris]|uniref:Uncharacterized protein n=1 Tax=Halorhodospira halochloris TaxID=1052 RepID=A0A2Z6EZQ2_HALHR|nr:hypothetical protein HH1059_20210 [Halorhodospira halochloris]
MNPLVGLNGVVELSLEGIQKGVDILLAHQIDTVKQKERVANDRFVFTLGVSRSISSDGLRPTGTA